MKPESKYLVVNVRKSDGQTFFPENIRHRKGIDDLATAMQIAENRAQGGSDAYLYVVYLCMPVVAVEVEDKPTKITMYDFEI